MTDGRYSTARRLPAAPPSEPSERERARWRSASQVRRQREKVGQRIYALPENEELVACALMVLHPGRTDLGDHDARETLLAAYLETCLLGLVGVIDDDSNLELRINIAKLLRDFRPSRR